MPRHLYCPRCKNTLEKMGNKYSCQNCACHYPIIDGIQSFVDQGVLIDTDGFDASAFQELFEIEEKHFWYIGRKEIILDFLRRYVTRLAEARMLEVGCGNGSVLSYLKQSGIKIEGGDLFLEGLKFCRQRAGAAPLYQIDILALPFMNDFDIIGLFDVLEHVENDEKALMEINRALKPGGNLILTVPANKFLWSYFDVRSHHKRRYSKRELTAKLERNGFVVKKISFYMFFLFPLLAVIRLIGNIFRGGKDEKQNIKAFLEAQIIPIVNNVFLGLFRLEKQFIKRLNLPFGASLLVLAEKTNGKQSK